MKRRPRLRVPRLRVPRLRVPRLRALRVRAPRPRAPHVRVRRFRRYLLAPVAAALLVVAGGVTWMALSPGPSPGTDGHAHGPSHSESQQRSPTLPPLGVYAGAGDVHAAEAIDRQLGGTVAYALDFLPEVSWTSISDPDWVASQWQGSPFEMVLAVPMLPKSGATLAEGAAGAYDPQFTVLAQRLVADGLGSAVLMIGWQPDDRGQPWDVASLAEAAEYVKYWDDIRAAMASVPGAHFVYEWDPGDGTAAPVDPAALYPGDAAVSVVAIDAFDTVPTGTPPATQWPIVRNERYGPAWMASFAAAHHKPMAIAMWGVVPVGSGGGGDDPTYVVDLLRWASTSRMQLCMLWDDGSWAITGGAFPAAAARLVQITSSAAAHAAADVRRAGGSVAPAVETGWDAPRTGVGRAVRTLR